RVPHTPPGKGRLRSMARRAHGNSGISGRKEDRPESRTSMGAVELSMSSRSFFSVVSGKGGTCRHPLVRPPDNPLWHSGDQCLTYSQNVAGLWLKYGAKPRNTGTSSLSVIVALGVKFC